mgnify:CR=1 FL=1
MEGRKVDIKGFEISDFQIKPEDPVFVIGVVSKMVQIPIWTLRRLDEMGVVCPKRIGKKTRCYSKKQLTTLSYVYHLMNEEGVNISGIRFILEQHGSDRDEGDI